jgi:hypothetical protein
VLIVVQHRQKDDFEIDESKIIFIKSGQNLYSSYDLKPVMKEQ